MEELVQHIINGLNLGAIYALIALGYTMVYGVLQLINFAHSEVYMVGAFAAYYGALRFNLVEHPGWSSFFVTLVIAMVACSILGLCIERFAYRPMRNAPRINNLITAIGVSLFLQFSGQLVFGADPKVFPEVLHDSVLFSFGEIQIRIFDVTILGVALVAMGFLNYFIHKTKTGMAIRAVSFSFRSATLMGINVNAIIMITFVLGSSLAGIGAVLVGLKYPKIDPLMGMLIGLKAFVAAVLGGIGNLTGAVVGGLMMGLLEEMVVAYISSTYRDALAFGLLIFILLVKPSGLFGQTRVEKV
ncbi:MAG: branched-chain amino acid ABC transporter permease [Bdellovibrionales bacterium]|nr:branched-chain amino acid ABC transporter permease [Bdellovibrionales bacterium]